MDGKTPRKTAAPPKTKAEVRAEKRDYKAAHPTVSLSKDLNDWHAENKTELELPVKFNVYIEGLIKADRCKHAMPPPEAPPEVVQAQAELKEHLRNKGTSLACE